MICIRMTGLLAVSWPLVFPRKLPCYKVAKRGRRDRATGVFGPHRAATYENLHLDLGAGFLRRLTICEQIWAKILSSTCEDGLAEAAVPAQAVLML